jgi:hypothetical protein
MTMAAKKITKLDSTLKGFPVARSSKPGNSYAGDGYTKPKIDKKYAGLANRERKKAR